MRSEYVKAQRRAVALLAKARISINESEEEKIEVVDFGLNNQEVAGLQLLTMF